MRTFLALAFVLATLIPLPAQAASHSWTLPWGPISAPARHAEASGTITVTPAPVGPWEIPYAEKVQIDGVVRDLTTPAVTVVDTCAIVIFRITHSSSYTSYGHYYGTCTFLTPRKFTFTEEVVRQVEMQVCAEPMRTTLRCTREGTWRTIYIAR
ncbi:hypothetical protein [Herbidospora yilanensis]|uniref:hypothetical protein n=1 Tax=Herbidospora yilanensis TaxID=354426 RepID=UPI0007850E69|nr:hypothetical protein [Herbidospora yilanensis]